jgi:hypothetical protein
LILAGITVRCGQKPPLYTGRAMRTSPIDWIVTFAYYAFDYGIGSYYHRRWSDHTGKFLLERTHLQFQ